MKKIIGAIIMAVVLASTLHAASVSDYNVVWETQSKNSTESMPLAGGMLGLNVWVEKGDLLFMMASTSCQNEMGKQVKLGLVRLHLAADPFANEFKQELHLAQSEIVVSGNSASGGAVKVTLWCGVEEPIIHVRVESAKSDNITVSYETWAEQKIEFKGKSLRWMIRNVPVNKYRQSTIAAQRMTDFDRLVPDPLSNLTCGGLIAANGLKPAGTGKGTFNGMPTRTATLKTEKAVKLLNLTIALRMEQDKDVETWERQLASSMTQSLSSEARDKEKSLKWWSEFWQRSHITINPDAGESDTGWQVGRNYQLSRYQLAANVNGHMPTLFNGGMFACNGNPDVRGWDYCYYIAQNMRLVYWPMLKSGDFDMMRSPFEYYRERSPMQRAFAKKWWGVDGIIFPEVIDPFGFDPTGIKDDGRSSLPHIRYHYTSCVDFAWMILKYAEYTESDIGSYMPFIEGIVSYYDNFYQKTYKAKSGKPLDKNGHLVIYPSDALETINGVNNSITDITGLTALAQGLLDLPSGYLTPEKRAYYKGFLKRIPPLTLKDRNGSKYLAPGKSYDPIVSGYNVEFPELYVCFPFDHFFLGRKGAGQENGIELASNTWDFGGLNTHMQKQHICWFQSAIFLARMGRTADAWRYTELKMLSRSLRFPAFYSNPGFCSPEPDTDHLGAGMIGLQEMIMQCDGKRILLGPAWPGEWNGSFKLHAPYQTVVEGHVTEGKVVVDKVTPSSRRKDIEIYPLKYKPLPPISQGKTASASSTFHLAGYEADKAVDGNENTRWSMDSGNGSGWLEVDLGKATKISRIVIQERTYPQTTRFAVEAQQADGSWKVLWEDKIIGANKNVKIKPTTAQKFRLNILESTLFNAGAGVTIDEFQLFAPVGEN